MAAGLGFKTFATGDILTAADTNGYLMSQTVMVFADSAARTTAITSPQQGMITFLKGTNSTEYYNGTAWTAISGGSSAGKVLQVVSATYSTQATTTSATYADTGLTASITPSSSTSKVLVLASQNAALTNSTQAWTGLRIVRGSTAIMTADRAIWGGSATTGNFTGSMNALNYLDSPATTSATTYKTQFMTNVDSGTSTGYVQLASSTSTITLMEIGA